MEMINKSIFVISISLVLQGCYMGSGNVRGPGIYLTSCDGYSQYTRNAETTIKIANDLHAEGKLTTKQLITVDQESGIYSQKIKNMCSFFKNGLISFEKYQEGVEKADVRYREIRKMVFLDLEKTSQ